MPQLGIYSAPIELEESEKTSVAFASSEELNIVLLMMTGISFSVTHSRNAPPQVDESIFTANVIHKISGFETFNLSEEFVDYAPLVFRDIREHFSISDDIYLVH